MSKLKFMALILSIAFIGLESCDKDPIDPVNNVLNDNDIPNTYSFDNVYYGGQTARLDMLEAMTSYMKSANTSGTTISATTLKEMFANENSPFSESGLNSSGKQIKSKTFASDVDKFETYMESLASLSGTMAEAVAGVAGIATSGEKAYLLNENGVEFTQLIEKGLMGALSYYQVSENYTRDSKIGNDIDNTIIEEGEGTAMEHHWDEAFGYIGANISLNDEEYRYHAKYSKKAEALINTRTNLLQSFLAGRAAISAKDMARKNKEAVNVRKYMEETTVTTAIHYLNGGKENFSNYAKRCHELSEAYAFVSSLKYNADAIISSTELATVLSSLQNDSGEPDFANLSVADLNDAINKLSEVYVLDAIKNSL